MKSKSSRAHARTEAKKIIKPLVLAALADGGWHSREELRHLISDKVPPELCIRHWRFLRTTRHQPDVVDVPLETAIQGGLNHLLIDMICSLKSIERRKTEGRAWECRIEPVCTG